MKAVWLSVLISGCMASGCRTGKTTLAPELAPGTTGMVGGHRLFWRQTGAGPDVVLLHGLGDSSLGWQFVEPGLVQAGYRVLVWDALGFGRSEKPSVADYTIEAHVKRLEALLDALAIQKVVLVGHSLGGSEALVFAERNPERVRALCLLDPAAYREGAMGGRWFWNVPLLADALLAALPARTISRFGLKANFHNHEAISSMLRAQYQREAKRPGARAALIAQERQLMPKDPLAFEQAHLRIRSPTLILWGQEDRLVPPRQGGRLTNDIRGARLVLLPGVGHSPHLEAPQAVLDQLLPFLNAGVTSPHSTFRD